MNVRRKIVVTTVSVILLLALGWALTPAPVGGFWNARVSIGLSFDDGPDEWIDFKNRISSAAYGLVPGTEARIVWREPGVRTGYAVVYLHGFSASRQEIAPVPERVAEQLDANLFEARLSGHGHLSSPMAGASAEGWITDADEALQIGAALGDKVILISTSTGSALSLAMLGYPAIAEVDTLIMVSPNLAVRDAKSKWLTRPGGPLLAELMTGGTRSWTPHNELQARYWTTSYPAAAVVEVMRLVNYANKQLPASIDQGLLMFVSPGDKVIDPDAAITAFNAIDAPQKRLVEIAAAGDPSSHVLAGDILSPENNARVIREIVDFILARPTATPAAPE